MEQYIIRTKKTVWNFYTGEVLEKNENKIKISKEVIRDKILDIMEKVINENTNKITFTYQEGRNHITKEFIKILLASPKLNLLELQIECFAKKNEIEWYDCITFAKPKEE